MSIMLGRVVPTTTTGPRTRVQRVRSRQGWFVGAQAGLPLGELVMAAYTLSARRCRRIIATLALAGLVAGCSATASATTASIDPLTRFVEQDVAVGAPGVIVRVDDGGGRPIDIARQAAWTTRDHRLAPGDQFRIGS